jgi:hypothetical protein
MENYADFVDSFYDTNYLCAEPGAANVQYAYINDAVLCSGCQEQR